MSDGNQTARKRRARTQECVAPRTRRRREAQVQVKSAPDIEQLKAEALADITKFAVWPMGLRVPAHQATWYRLSQMYKVDPRFRKLILLCPTGWGKTVVGAICIPIYEMVCDRSIQIGIISNNAFNAKEKLSVVTRHLLGNRDLIEAFGYRGEDGVPRFKPQRPRRWTTEEIVVAGADEVAAEKGKHLLDPTFVALGWEGQMEGRHFDLLIGDDIVDYIDAQSPLRRGQYISWYENILKNRMNPDGRELWIGTRAHAADLYQYLIETKEYVLIDEPQALIVGEDGQEVSSWPDRWPTEALIAERNRDPVSFMLKRMNRIIGSGMSEFDRDAVHKCRDETLVYYGNTANLPRWLTDKNLVVYAGVDLAVGLTREAMYFVIVVVGVDRATGDRYILDLVRGRFGIAEQKQKVRQAFAAWGPVRVLVENNGAQAYFYEDALEGVPVRGLMTGTNKLSLDEGIPSLVALVQAGKLHIPWGDAAAQARSYVMVKELLDYPKGATSDTVMAWWMAEREIRTLFLAGPSISPSRNFFQRSRRQSFVRLAGGFRGRAWGG